MSNQLYTMQDCPLCEAVKVKLRDLGLEYKDYNMDDLMSGELRDEDVMAQLAMQGMAAPVLCIGGSFVDPTEFLNW